MGEVTTLIQTFGFPAGLLLIFLGLGWKLILWVKPWAEKGIQGHVNLLEATSKAIEQIGDAHDRQSGTITKILEGQIEIAKRVDQIHQDGCKWGRARKDGAT